MALYNRKERIKKNCVMCGKSFYVLPSRIGKKLCSRSCSARYGIKIGRIKKVKPGWNKGKKTPASTRKKQREAKLKNPTRYWLGKTRSDLRNPNSMKRKNESKYVMIHRWVRRIYGEPKLCERCGSVKKIQWSNKDHKYNNIKNNWQQLCPKCHKIYDKTALGIKA